MKKNILGIFTAILLSGLIILTIFIMSKELVDKPIESTYVKEKAIITGKERIFIKYSIYRLEIVTKDSQRKIIYRVPEYEYDYYQENQEIYISYRHEIYKDGGADNINISIWDTEWED